MKDILTFFDMLKAILRRQYPMPWKTFILAVLCFFYVLSPIDILPDVMPLLGITDDATFILLVVALLQKDLQKYRASLQAPKDKVIDLGDVKDHKK
ncbi:MAG: DUF1232 domain-containing protein [Elusimicrobiaceae bacterium]|nr:DUF1232 domain-containing protein [Elusimicrobiaceae bacterium]